MFVNTKNIIDVIKYKWVCITISALLILPGIAAMIYSTATLPTHSPLRLGIDFTGGTIVQYNIDKEVSQEELQSLRKDLTQKGFDNLVIQKLEAEGKELNNIISIRTRFLESEKNNNEISKIDASIKKTFGKYQFLQTSAVGPTLSKELFTNSLAALLLAFAGIVLYLTIRFQLDYAIFALLALFHDAIFVCGIFSILGIFYGVQVDSLFITAILTVIGFSVHDTIVVFDRIRENNRFLAKKKTFNEIVNISVNQTLSRSINTSVTSIITLLALFMFGGVTTKDFVLAMILGIAIGTYSSIFFASMFLADYRTKKGLGKQVKKPKKAVA